jgi:hypothetical protein
VRVLLGWPTSVLLIGLSLLLATAPPLAAVAAVAVVVLALAIADSVGGTGRRSGDQPTGPTSTSG